MRVRRLGLVLLVGFCLAAWIVGRLTVGKWPGDDVAVPVFFAWVEEWVFRGLLLRWLARHCGEIRALLLSSLVFALLHLQAHALPSTLLDGLVLGAVYLLSGRLSLAVLVHAATNDLVHVLAAAERTQAVGCCGPNPLAVLLGLVVVAKLVFLPFGVYWLRALPSQQTPTPAEGGEQGPPRH